MPITVRRVGAAAVFSAFECEETTQLRLDAWHEEEPAARPVSLYELVDRHEQRNHAIASSPAHSLAIIRQAPERFEEMIQRCALVLRAIRFSHGGGPSCGMPRLPLHFVIACRFLEQLMSLHSEQCRTQPHSKPLVGPVAYQPVPGPQAENSKKKKGPRISTYKCRGCMKAQSRKRTNQRSGCASAHASHRARKATDGARSPSSWPPPPPSSSSAAVGCHQVAHGTTTMLRRHALLGSGPRQPKGESSGEDIKSRHCILANARPASSTCSHSKRRRPACLHNSGVVSSKNSK